MKLLLLIFFFTSCAGYNLVSRTNPFEQYNISTLAVPMFYNNTNLAGVSALFTGEVINVLSPFNGLKIVSKDNADAHLIGIITSADKRSETIKGINKKSAKNLYEDQIGGRDDFFLYSSNRISLSVRFILIKHPTKEQIKLLKNLDQGKLLSSKILLDEKINISQSFNLKELDEAGVDVLGTQNKGLERKAIELLAQKAATDFKEIILYAY